MNERRDALAKATNFVPTDHHATTDDCGFSPFSIGENPDDSSPGYARDITFRTIKNRVEGKRLAVEKPGI